MTISEKQVKLERLRQRILRDFAEHVFSTGSVPNLSYDFVELAETTVANTDEDDNLHRDSASGDLVLEDSADTATIVAEAVSERSVTADEDSLKNVSVLAEKLREQ